MRNPERIKPIMEIIQEIWTKYSDLRFHQLISYLQSEFHKETGNGYYVENEKGNAYDMFYVEDDIFYPFLVTHLQKINKENKGE